MLNTPKSWITLIIQTDSLDAEKISKTLKLNPDYFQDPEFKEDGSVEESGIWVKHS